MKLNVGKCKELIIDFAKKTRHFPPLTVGDVNIERVKSTCILGLTIQDNMKWNKLIQNIVKKAGKSFICKAAKKVKCEHRHIDN